MKEKISMIVFVLVLGGVLTTALVAVDHYTKPRIDRNKAFKLNTRVLGALGIPYTKENVEKKFLDDIEEKKIEGKSFYISQDGNVAFEIAGSGLWGPIEGILALSPDLETIKGIAIIHQEETPGLGGRIVERDFLDKFAGKKIVPEIRVTKPDKASAENEVDGITGATATCERFEAIINSQAKEYTSLYTKGNP